MTPYLCLVACRDLKNDDGSSAKIEIIRAATGSDDEIGRTKELHGDDPVFDKIFEFECDNPADDMIKVTILDENDQSRGVGVFTLEKIFQHPKKLGYLELSSNRGAIVIHAREKVETGTLKLKLKGKNLKNTEGFTRLRLPDPFFTLSKPEGGAWKNVLTSHTIKDTLEPEWNECEISITDLCDGEYEKTLKLEVYDEERGGKHVIIGSREISLKQMLDSSPDQTFQIDEAKEKTGEIFVASATLEDVVSSTKEAKLTMRDVAIALKSRSDAIEKGKAIESLKEEAAAAKAAAEAAQAAADEKAAALAEAEGAVASLVAAANEAEAAIGGLSSN